MKNLKLPFSFISILTLSLLSTLSLAQTQRIAHKSHSGTTQSFTVHENSKNNLGLDTGAEAFWDLQSDSVAFCNFLKDSTAGKEFFEAINKYETREDYFKFTQTKEGEKLSKKLKFSRFNHDINESLLYFNYDQTKKYILELMARHKNDKKDNSSGSIFSTPNKYQNYAFLPFFVGMLGLVGWLYKESKTV